MSIETSVNRLAGQIQTQADLIEQIKTALADKAAGNVNVPGFVAKYGETTTASFDTGLSEIEEVFVFKDSLNATGLIFLEYSKANAVTGYLYCSSWSTSTYGTTAFFYGNKMAAANGGVFTIPETTATQGGLTSGVTYWWVAIGTE